jgi:hypothetical protein
MSETTHRKAACTKKGMLMGIEFGKVWHLLLIETKLEDTHCKQRNMLTIDLFPGSCVSTI